MFSVIERTSIKRYHEIFRKYAEGVTGLNPRPPSQAPARPSGIEQVHFTMGGHDEALRVVGVKRSGTLGTENECRPL